MKNYIVYLDNGQITKSGQCQDIDFDKYGPNVIEGVANDSTQYVENGQIVDMPPKPDGEAYFNYETKQWIRDSEAQGYVIKAKRNMLLAESDWTQLPDVPINTKTQWATYRQELRDVTSQTGYPFDVIWPTKPE